MTDYEDYPSTNSKSKVVTDCAYSIDPATGTKIVDQPARLIIDDTYLKSDEKPNGSVQNYQIKPQSMCRIMLANTLNTTYRHYFNWYDQSFVYWTALKLGSQRFDKINLLWDQRQQLVSDKYDKRYYDNISFDYVDHYKKEPAYDMAATGLYNFAGYNQLQYLWPREMIYLYAINQGETA